MASLWRDLRSPYFVACFTGVAGQRRVQWKRSTGTADRKLARRIADELEESAQGRRKGEDIVALLEKVTDLRARRKLHQVFDEVLRSTTGRGLGGKSVRAVIANWLETARREVSKATWQKYQQTSQLFLKSLGPVADQDISAVRREDISRFRDEQGGRRRLHGKPHVEDCARYLRNSGD